MVRISSILAVIAIASATSGPSLAQPQPLNIPRHLPPGKDACFGRVYDARHLAAHPQQRVTSFHLFRDFSPDTNAEEKPLLAGKDRATDDPVNVGLTAYVRFRDRPGVFSNWMTCFRQNDGQVRCGVECDGGSFKLRTRGTSLIVENEGFVVSGGCGASEDEQEQQDYVKPGADDRLFRLDKLPLAACRAVRDSMKPAWAKLGSPIRVRLTRADGFCYARTYDARHLAGHPEQHVRRISVALSAEDNVDKDLTVRKMTFRVETKDGQRFEKTTSCWPSRYAYACQHDPAADVEPGFYLTRAGKRHIALRDRKGRLAQLVGAVLGSDDRLFKLNASAEADCTF